MKNFKRYFMSSLALILFLTILNGCAMKTVKINGQEYLKFDETSFLNAQYIKGFIGNYEGLVAGRAYGVPSANFMWLSKDIKFSKYKNITIVDFENLSGKKTIRYTDKEEDIDISQIVTNAFMQSTALRKVYKKISRVNDEAKVSSGLIIKGAVTHASAKLPSVVHSEILIMDGKTKKTVGKMILSSTHAHFEWAVNNLSSITAEVIQKYWNSSPGFDSLDFGKE